MQTWCLTVAAELRRLGHDVVIVDVLSKYPGDNFELGIIANWAYCYQWSGCCDNSVNISHGVVQDEKPGDAWGGNAFTSEEVRAHWNGSGPIIRQPIDLEFWTDTKQPRSGFVRYSPRAGLPWLRELSLDMGQDFTHVREASPEDARDTLRRAECVFATGRAALEAAACGAPVVILDSRSYQGDLLAPFGAEQMKRNYSGRGGEAPTPMMVTALATSAMINGSQRSYVERFHDSRRVVAELLGAIENGTDTQSVA